MYHQTLRKQISRHLGKEAEIPTEYARLFDEISDSYIQYETEKLKQHRSFDAIKAEFINNVSHEIRTPLTSMLGLTQIIKKKLLETVFPSIHTSEAKVTKSIKQIKDNLDIVIGEGDRLTTVITNLLNS